MRRFRPLAFFLMFPALLLVALDQRAAAQKGEFGTALKGRVVWRGDIPERQNLKVQNLPPACGKVIADESILVNPKNRGVKGSFVWLTGEGGNSPPVHPTLAAVPKEVAEMDLPRCVFVPRLLAVREGQTVLFKNSSGLVHNVRTVSPTVDGDNITRGLAPGKSFNFHPKAQMLPLLVECNIHGWMRARIAVFDHPYFALTAEDGSFEIKLPPAGKYRLKVYHEYIGWRGGAAGREGHEVEIKAGTVTDLKDLEISKAKKK